MFANTIWDEADSFGPAQLVRRFEAAWKASDGRRPDPSDYLPAQPGSDPAALLALLRSDLTLRREAGEPVRLEDYRDRFPELEGAGLVALLYEDYCLREEAGESPSLAEYEERFPGAAAELHQVLEIHSLVRVGQTALTLPGPSTPSFPEAGQTIAGFRLVEELGRGSFARVFRAEERQLADRPVALKVTRAASREPQALARLQHTHIVPVHSYRTDPVTGLHLLCMPYLGRVTLADVLAHPRAWQDRGGADLVAALDQLGGADDLLAKRSAGRRALARRDQPRAIAWWGARLADALQHAHDRGVLHRDIKPSNVLITGDGLPMLLDFNLAQESWVDDSLAAPSALGGTLAYMAPEHLEALAEGALDRVDGRADVYALGVVLFEALAGGVRPFPPPVGLASIPQILLRTAEERRSAIPRLRSVRPDVPIALEVVVERCLAAEPGDRYASAAELAADLQAVDDDAPLRFAAEPFSNRARRWVRRNRRPLILATPPVLALAALAIAMSEARLTRLRLNAKTLEHKAEIQREMLEGRHAYQQGELDRAGSLFKSAARQAARDPDLRLHDDEAAALYRRASRAKAVRARADTLFAGAEPIRFGLLGFTHDPEAAVRDVESLLRLFSIPDASWTRNPELGLLDEPRLDRLRAEADELLFLWVVALDRGLPPRPERDREALRLCDAARSFVAPGGPWEALRARYVARLAGRAPTRSSADPRQVDSALACFQWGLLCTLETRPDATISWLERAIQLRNDDYWSEFYLGYRYEQAGHLQRAIEHYSVAVALRREAPWALLNRAKLCARLGEWEQARTDVQSALAASSGFELLDARLESGLIRAHFGDSRGARDDYEAVVASSQGQYAQAARLNLANLDVKAGAVDRARSSYDALLAEDPHNRHARLGRALLARQNGQAGEAEADLTRVLQDEPGDSAGYPSRSDVHAQRAFARMDQGRAVDALDDAAAALRLRATPAHERLWVRTLFGAGRDSDLYDLLIVDDPDDLDRLPSPGPALNASIRKAAARLRRLAEGGGPIAAPALRTRAVLLAAIGDPVAEDEASRALALASGSADGYLIRARVRRRAGDRPAAMQDVKLGLILAPGNPRLLELRGLLQLELGHPEEALADLDRAFHRGARGTVRVSKSRALMALGRYKAARDAWTFALEYDPDDPRAYLGRARALLRLKRRDQAIADLEQAAALPEARGGLLANITLTYLTCLPGRPDCLPQVLALARRTWADWLTTHQFR